MEEQRIYLLETLRSLDYQIIDHMYDKDEVARLEKLREQLRKELHDLSAGKAA